MLRSPPNHSMKERMDMWSIPEPNTGCLLWIGALDEDGYGVTKFKRKTKSAYRESYKLSKGEIPKGLVLDHLCRVRSCINPDHLEAVTNFENHRRGRWANQTHCKNGHLLAGDNIYWRCENQFGLKTNRGCKICRNAANKRCNDRKRGLLVIT